MTNIIEQLAKLATDLEGISMPKTAGVVDSITNRMLQVKTAQYVGIQGYWIRNRRCWENCYRQKRASSPNLAAQEVWTECHQEYLQSINNDNSGWEKYADKLPNIIKVASNDKTKKFAAAEEAYFNKTIKDKIANGEPAGNAVFNTIDNYPERYINVMLDASDKLLDIAGVLEDNGNSELASIAAQCSENIIKESQFNQGSWWNPMNWKGNTTEKLKQWTGTGNASDAFNRLSRALKATDALRTRFPADMSTLANDPERNRRVNEQFFNFQNQIANELNVLEQMTAKDPSAGRMYQKVYPVFQQFSNATSLPSRRRALDVLSNAISSALGVAGQASTNPANAPQQPQQQPQSPNFDEVELEGGDTQPSASQQVPSAADIPAAQEMASNLAPQSPTIDTGWDTNTGQIPSNETVTNTPQQGMYGTVTPQDIASLQKLLNAKISKQQKAVIQDIINQHTGSMQSAASLANDKITKAAKVDRVLKKIKKGF